LHVTSSVGDEINVNLRTDRPIDHAIGLEERLSVLADSKREQFSRIRASPREPGKPISRSGGGVKIEDQI
jgi:hypothetical protein